METALLVLVIVLAAFGSLLLLLASIGLVRMPDVYMRMQVASKASTLGAALVLGAAALGLGDGPAAVRAVVAIVFLCITTPLAAHLLARAAAHTGVPFSSETKPLELPPSPFEQEADAEAASQESVSD